MNSLELKPINLLKELKSLISSEKQSKTSEAEFTDVFIKSTIREQLTAEISQAYYSFDPRQATHSVLQHLNFHKNPY